MKNIKIAILDTSKVIDDLISNYEPIFKDLFSSCEFEKFYDKNRLISYLKDTQVDILISDLSLGNKIDYQGLNLVKSIKEEYPEILIIGNSVGELTYRQTASKYPTFDIYVDKARLKNDDDYVAYIKYELIEKKFRKNIRIRIKESSTILEPFNNIENKDLNSIIQQCTFSGLPNEHDVSLKFADLKPLTGGRSGSAVYGMEATVTDEDISTIPAVIKISERTSACQELRNYNKYVRWLLPYTWRVDILGTGFTKKYGGICYSFILSGEKEFDSLTYYISKKDDERIEYIYTRIFSPKSQKWYQIIKKDNKISKRYFKRYFWENCDNETNEFKQNIQKHFKAILDPNKITINDIDFNYPYDTLFGDANNIEYNICICHGDLNSNNIIVSANNNLLFIDFQDTGFGHVFEDFIAFESSLRLNYPLSNDYSAHGYLDMEMSINTLKDDFKDYSYIKHINQVRKLAFDNFPMEKQENYYYALAAYSFRLMRLAGLSEDQKIRITSCLLSCLSKKRRKF